MNMEFPQEKTEDEEEKLVVSPEGLTGKRH